MPRRVKLDPSIHDPDWKKRAEAFRAKAARLPQGHEKEKLLRLARQFDAALHMKEWLQSPGVAPPSQ